MKSKTKTNRRNLFKLAAGAVAGMVGLGVASKVCEASVPANPQSVWVFWSRKKELAVEVFGDDINKANKFAKAMGGQVMELHICPECKCSETRCGTNYSKKEIKSNGNQPTQLNQISDSGNCGDTRGGRGGGE